MVEIHFRMSKSEFDALLTQMSRRIHNLRNRLHVLGLQLEVQPDDPQVKVEEAQVKSDLSIMEILREQFQSGVHVVRPYVAPLIDFHDEHQQEGGNAQSPTVNSG